MDETSVTASTIINSAEKLEETSTKFYENLAEKYDRESFWPFAEESKKNRILITRTYQETITDALEACFIKGLDPSNNMTIADLSGSESLEDALKISIAIEEKAAEFYTELAEKTRSLLATMPMAFRKVAQNRKNRIEKLEFLLNDLEGRM